MSFIEKRRQKMRQDDIMEMVTQFNSDLIDGEDVMTFAEMEAIVTE